MMQVMTNFDNHLASNNSYFDRQIKFDNSYYRSPLLKGNQGIDDLLNNCFSLDLNKYFIFLVMVH